MPPLRKKSEYIYIYNASFIPNKYRIIGPKPGTKMFWGGLGLVSSLATCEELISRCPSPGIVLLPYILAQHA